MDRATRDALARDLVIDITTTGRKSGEPRRIEIWFHNLDGAIYLTGRPGKRGWYANLLVNPEFTFHLKESAKVDIRARASPVTQPSLRRAVLEEIIRKLGRPASVVEQYVAGSPLVRVELLAD